MPAAPAGAGDVIVGIRVVGYQTVSPDTIAHYLGIKVGDTYDPEKIRQNFPALWETGLLENAKIEAERSSAGVTLVVTVEERPIVKDVDFIGNKKLSTSQIKDRLKEAKVDRARRARRSRCATWRGRGRPSPITTSSRVSAAPPSTTGSRTSRRPRRRSSS